MNTIPPRLEHIGIAVADAAFTAEILKKVLGVPVYMVEDVVSEQVRTHFISAGTAKLELLEATAPDSPIAKYLENNREGLHHLAFEVADIDAAWERAKAAGLEVLGQGPKTGADGKKIFFLHPRSTGGVLIEFCAQQPLTLAPRMIDVGGRSIRTYAAGRDGTPRLLVLPDAGRMGLAQGLAQDWQVVAVDTMDLVDREPTSRELEEQASVVIRVLDVYDWPIAALLGFGLGATVALHLAAIAPERVTAVVAHAPRPMPVTPSKAPVLLSALDTDPAFTPADAVRMLERYPEARLAITPDWAWGAAHPALQWLADQRFRLGMASERHPLSK
ncbi:MAG: methylmalonyl-CoA epimerase [Rhodothermales bacterium]|nr:methylmalonyl-CoA epimerase [Rhodothermales bacterium]